MSKIKSLYIEVVVFKREKKNILYLILQRSKQNKIFPGIHQIITGTIKSRNGNNTESAVKAAIREIREETKLNPKRIWILPIINSYYVFEKDTINLSPIFAAEVDPSAEPILSNEHQSYKWMRLDEAVEKLIWQSHKNALKYLNDYLTEKSDWGKFLEIKFKNKSK